MDVLHVASNYILTHHTISSKPIYLYEAGLNKGLEENNSVSVQYVIKQKKKLRIAVLPCRVIYGISIDTMLSFLIS